MKIINNRLQQAMQMQLFYCLSYVKGEYHIYQWFKHTSCAIGENDIPVVSYTPVFSGFGGSLYQIPAGKAQPQNAEIELVNYYDNHSFLNFNGFHKKDACYNILNGGSSINARNLLTGTVMRSSDGSMLCSVTYYDDRYRPSDVRSTYTDGVAVVMATEYSFTGKPLTVQYTVYKDGAAIPMTIENTYGEANDLPVSSVLKANGGETILASNEYDGLGRLSKVTRGSNALYQQYSYNVRGWLTQIAGNGFREELYYTDGAVPCYNGDISRVKWNGDTSTPTYSSYDFRYDSLDRLVASEYTLHADTDKNFDNSEYFTYNSNGSPLTLKRHGRYMITARDIGYALVNDMSFCYDGNRLTGISDAGFYSGFTSPYVFHENISADIGYAYNSNGSMTRNPDRHIGLIEYDGFNNPCLIQFTDGSVTEYVYDASGVKLKTLHRTAVPGIEVPYGTVYEHTSSTVLSSDSTLYAGPFVLSGDSLRYKYDGGSVLIPLNGSPVKPTFYALDHLGSVRLVVSADGQVIERNDYYPSGCMITGNITNEGNIQPYKYNGKELDPMHGLYTYDYGARQYDPATMLWDRMDPLGEENPEVSPYVYCGDNPVNAIDPDGKKKVNWLGKSETGLLEKDFNDFADEFNVINIWAHGNNNGFRPRITGGRNLNKVIKTAEDFKKVIDYAKLFDKINPKNSIIVLHSCKTAEFAKKISNEGFFKENNITIIAPTENIVVTKSPQNSNSSFFTNLFDKFFGNDKPDFNYTTEVKTIIKNGEKKGKWNAYNKGRLVITYDSKEKPGSKGFNYKFINNGKR